MFIRSVIALIALAIAITLSFSVAGTTSADPSVLGMDMLTRFYLAAVMSFVGITAAVSLLRSRSYGRPTTAAH